MLANRKSEFSEWHQLCLGEAPDCLSLAPVMKLWSFLQLYHEIFEGLSGSKPLVPVAWISPLWWGEEALPRDIFTFQLETPWSGSQPQKECRRGSAGLRFLHFSLGQKEQSVLSRSSSHKKSPPSLRSCNSLHGDHSVTLTGCSHHGRGLGPKAQAPGRMWSEALPLIHFC